MIPQIDVLAIVARRQDLEAAEAAGSAHDAASPGVRHWQTSECDGSPIRWGEYRVDGDRRFTVALARATRTGGRAAGTFVAGLACRLNPGCLAMCGTCAGDPARTALGDVVVGDRVYEWDEGKRSASEHEPDHWPHLLDPRLLRAAQDFDPTRLTSYGEASEDAALLWFLEQLDRGQEPRSHPARQAYFPPGSWKPRLARLEREALIYRVSADRVALTAQGVERVRRRFHDDVDGPERLPFRVLAAPIASGSAVIADPRTWPGLRRAGMQKLAAADMEAATVATVAGSQGRPWLVAKGVTNFGDPRKDDRYQHFAARASAEVMFALLSDLFAADGARPSPGEPETVDRRPASTGSGAVTGKRKRRVAVLAATTVPAVMSLAYCLAVPDGGERQGVTCPDRHVAEADKVLIDGEEALTVADFHLISGSADHAADHPRVRIDGGNLLGENGADLRLLRGVPEADRLNCDTGEGAYVSQVPLASIDVGDVIVARSSQYVGKIKITGVGEGRLVAKTTSYFLLQE